MFAAVKIITAIIKIKRFCLFTRHEELQSNGSTADLISKVPGKWSCVVIFKLPSFCARRKDFQTSLEYEDGLKTGLVWTVWKRVKFLSPGGNGNTIRTLFRP
jgi:hypothetical protein